MQPCAAREAAGPGLATTAGVLQPAFGGGTLPPAGDNSDAFVGKLNGDGNPAPAMASIPLDRLPLVARTSWSRRTCPPSRSTS